MNIYIHTIKMTGRGAFPVDMLRYDRCFPASETDAYAIARTFEHHESWEITLSKYSANKNPGDCWTFARWASFNCYKG